MNNHFRRFRSLGGAFAFAACLSGIASAQDEDVQPKASKPMFAVLPAKPGRDLAGAPALSLPTWNGGFTYKGRTYTYSMVGTAPATGSSTTVPTYIIPLKIIITSRTGTKTTFDPLHTLANGKTVVQNTVDSPLFDFTTTYVQGGVNVGTTQYVDAYQRANLWGAVAFHTGYHVLLGGPTVLAEQTLSPPTNKGKLGSNFGHTEGEVNIDWMDAQLNSLITSLGIQANTYPIFLVNNVYLTGPGCCIGGYHSATGAQSYTFAAYLEYPGVFSQDVSALSHEIGEWMDDPLVANLNTPCGILENGDPLEGGANYGGYPYELNGFTYNLQDLVTLPYFGAPPGTSVNQFFTFQGQNLRVCQNGS